MVSSFLETGPDMNKAEKYCLLGCTDQIKEGWLWISYFAYKKHAPGWAFYCLQELTSPGSGSVSIARNIFKTSKHHNTQKIKNVNNTPTTNIPNRSGRFVTTNERTSQVIIIQSPSITSGFILGVVAYSMGLNTCITRCIHQYSII